MGSKPARTLWILCLALAAVLPSAASDLPRFPTHTWQVNGSTGGVLVEDHRTPTVTLILEFPAGSWSRWGQAEDLQTALAISLYDPEGTLRKRSDRLAAPIYLHVEDRYGSLSVSFLKDDMKEVLDLVRDVLANRRFDGKELRRWKQEAGLTWKSRATDVRFQGRRLVARSLFQEDDPRRKPLEKPRQVETDTGKLRSIRDRLIRLPGRTIGLAGDLTPEEAEPIARNLLPPAGEPDVDLEPALLPIRPRADREDTVTHIRRLTQVYFGLGRESLTYDDPDYPAFVLSNHVLGGHFYSRLMVALRHEGGETYGAFASSEGGMETGPYVLGSFTRAANAAHAEEKMRETLKVFHERGITEEERAETVSHFLGAAPFGRQYASQVLLRRLQERRGRLPERFFDELPHRMERLSLGEINDFIAKFFDPDRFVLGSVAPEK